MRLPPLESIRYFESAARHMSFTLAAEELCISQSAVSQKISQLESRLGYRLFVRKTRKLELTDRGQYLLPKLTASLNTLEQTFFQAALQESERPIKIYCMPSFATRWLMPNMHQFQEKYPDIQLDICADINTPNLNEVDIGIHHGFCDQPSMVLTKLLTDYVYPVASPALADKYNLYDLNNLGQVPFLHDTMPQLQLSTCWSAWLRENNLPHISSQKGYRYNTADLVMSAAANGQGVALARHVLASKDIQEGRLVPLNDRYIADQDIYLVCSKLAMENPRIKLLVDWITQLASSFESENLLEITAA